MDDDMSKLGPIGMAFVFPDGGSVSFLTSDGWTTEQIARVCDKFAAILKDEGKTFNMVSVY